MVMNYTIDQIADRTTSQRTTRILLSGFPSMTCFPSICIVIFPLQGCCRWYRHNRYQWVAHTQEKAARP